MCANIREVGEATGRTAQAATVVREFEERAAVIEQSVANLSRPRVLCLEWLDPPYVGGHWIPEMVRRAGGVDVVGREGEPSFRVNWEAIAAAKPEVIAIMPCGYNAEQAAAELRSLNLPPVWQDLPAVCTQRVWAVDASSYFSRPGPRLIDGMEILANVIHAPRATSAVAASVGGRRDDLFVRV